MVAVGVGLDRHASYEDTSPVRASLLDTPTGANAAIRAVAASGLGYSGLTGGTAATFGVLPCAGKLAVERPTMSQGAADVLTQQPWNERLPGTRKLAASAKSFWPLPRMPQRLLTP